MKTASKLLLVAAFLSTVSSLAANAGPPGAVDVLIGNCKVTVHSKASEPITFQRMAPGGFTAATCPELTAAGGR